MTNRAWVTLATNDSYGLGALVLAHSIRRTNSAYPSVVLITPAVTEPMQERLRAVFAEVITVDVLDSRDAAHLALLQRPELGITFTKIHCWSLTQYEKCVFLDADTLVIQNSDELFEREELSAAPDVGWPDCFNSGVFVFCPSKETFDALIKFAQERGSFDGGDQGLLNSFFSDWARGDINKHLPFLYNVTSAAFYSYLPAFKHFGQDLKIIHFIGVAKPWLQPYNWDSRSVDAPDHLRDTLQLWWEIFTSSVHSQLDSAMVEQEVATHLQEAESPIEDLTAHYYEPAVDPESEFPWHHADANQTQEEENKIDLTELYDPWQNYRGNIPPKSGYIRPNNEGKDGDTQEQKQNIWQYQQPHQYEQSHTYSQPHDHRQHDNQEYHHEHQNDYYQVPHQDQYHQESHENQWQHETQQNQGQHWQHEMHQNQWHHHEKNLHNHDYGHESHQDHHHNQYHHHQHNEGHSWTTEVQVKSHDHSSHHDTHASHSHSAHVYTVGQVHQNHVGDIKKKRIRHRHSKTRKPVSLMNGDVSETESEDFEVVMPRHPYDGFYLRHRATIDSRGRKVCTHELPPSPPPSPPPPSPPPLSCDSDELQDIEDQSGVAGNLARVVPGAPGAQREAIDELTRRQGWEAGNIDYMGADAFDNIWAKISQTLNQAPKQPTPPPSEPSPPPKEPSPVKEATLSSEESVTPVAASTEEATTPAAEVIATEPEQQQVAPAEVSSPVTEPVKEALPVEVTKSIESTESPIAKEESVPVQAAPVEAVPVPVETPEAKLEPVVPPTPPATPKTSPEPSSTPVTEELPKLEEEKRATDAKKDVVETKNEEVKETVPESAAVEVPKEVSTVVTEVPKEDNTVTAEIPSESPAEVPSSPPTEFTTPEKSVEVSTATTDSPPLANTPAKEEVSPPVAKSAAGVGERPRKPAGKLCLSPPERRHEPATPDSELEDAATLAQSIIAGELATPIVTSPASPAPPAPAPTLPRQGSLAVEDQVLDTPPAGLVSLAQIGVKPKPTIAAQIESSLTDNKQTPAAAATTDASTKQAEAPASPVKGPAKSAPAEAKAADAPKKKVVKKVVKKDPAAAAAGDAPVPPPRKKEKKPKDK